MRANERLSGTLKRRLAVGLFGLYLLFLPLQWITLFRVSILNVGIHQLIIVTIIGLIVWSSPKKRNLLSTSSKSFVWLLTGLGAFLVLAIPGIIFSIDPVTATGGWLSYLWSSVVVIVAFVLIRSANGTGTQPIKFWYVLGLGGLILAVTTLILSLGWWEVPWDVKTGGFSRHIGTFQIPFERVLPLAISFGSWGQIVIASAALTAGLYFHKKLSIRFRLFLGVAVLVMAMAVFATQSRSTWLGFGVAALSFLLVYHVANIRIVSVLLAAMITTILLVTLVPGNFAVNAINSHGPTGPGAAVSVDLKRDDYVQAKRIVSNPMAALRGVGSFNFSKHYRDIPVSLHNAWLDRIVATGIPGGLVFFTVTLGGLALLVIRSGGTRRNAVSAALIAAYMGNLVEMLSHPSVADSIFWILLAWAFVPNRIWTTKFAEHEYTSEPAMSQ